MATSNDPLQQAYDAMARGDQAAAERICKSLLSKNARNPDALMLLGVVEASRGDLQDAATRFELAAKLDPAWPDVHFNLGLVRQRQGRTADALALFDRTLSLDARNRGALRGRANALFELSRWPDAIPALKAEVAQEPGN